MGKLEFTVFIARFPLFYLSHNNKHPQYQFHILLNSNKRKFVCKKSIKFKAIKFIFIWYWRRRQKFKYEHSLVLLIPRWQTFALWKISFFRNIFFQMNNIKFQLTAQLWGDTNTMLNRYWQLFCHFLSW